MDTLFHDLRYAWRHIRRSPGFAAAAILTLALGIGANTAMFSMLNALLIQRLPIEDPDGLIAIAPRTSRGLARSVPMSAVDVLAADGPLDHLCAYLGGVVFPVIANNVPMQAGTTFVTGQCFNALGVRPILGRAIEDSDAPIYGRGARAALISHRFWTNVFAADPAVLGKPMLVNNVEVAIIGVLPPRFVGLEVDTGIDIFTTFDSVLAASGPRRQLASYLLGRLRSGVSLEQAAAQLESRWPAVLDAVVPNALAASEREQIRDSQVRLERFGTGTSRLRERYVQPITLVMGLTALLLLLACVNLGGLLLARFSARNYELAVRLALGGTAWRIARQMLMESLLLSSIGALLAVPLAYAVAQTLPSFMPPVNLPYTLSFAPDRLVIAVTMGIAVVVGVVMTAIPVWSTIRRRSTHLISSDRTVVGTASAWSRTLLVAQIALSLVMLVGAALLTRSLYLLQTADLGIHTANILNVKVGPLPNAPAARADRAAYYPQLLEKIAALPGVRSVALASSFPRVSTAGRMPVHVLGEEPRGVETAVDYISPGFFKTMGIRVLIGREPAWSDTLQSRTVAVISESLARALTPGGDIDTLIEQSLKYRTMPVDQEMVIVGVAADATQGDLRNPHPHVVYRAALQLSPTNAFNPNLLIESSDTAAVSTGVRQILREGGREYAQEIIALEDLFARAPVTERMSATVAATAGGLGVVLALVGVHAALAYSVSRRRREIGVRVAVGATPSSVARAVVREAVMVTALGVALGLPIAIAAARSLRSLLYGISEGDMTTFAASSLFFLAVGAAAGLLPARRASAVDPVIALRTE